MTDDPSSLPAAPEEHHQERKSGGSRAVGIVRATAVVLLMTIGALLATVSVPAIWGRNLILNTDRYVSTLKPLASDPGVQAGIIKAIDSQIESNVDVSSIVKSALPGRAGTILAGPLESATDTLVNTVTTKFVESQAFVTLWTTVNRVAHKQVVAILTGSADDRKALNIKNDQVVLNLQPVVDAVKAQLVSSGLTVAAKVPAVNTTIEIANVKGIDKARSLTKLVNKVAHWLPVIAIVLLLAAIGLSRRRRRGTIIAGMSVALGMVILAAALAIGRKIYLDAAARHLSSDRRRKERLQHARPLPARWHTHRARRRAAGLPDRLAHRSVQARAVDTQGPRRIGPTLAEQPGGNRRRSEPGHRRRRRLRSLSSRAGALEQPHDPGRHRHRGHRAGAASAGLSSPRVRRLPSRQSPPPGDPPSPERVDTGMTANA